MFVEIVDVLHVTHQTAGFAEQNGEKVKLNGQCSTMTDFIRRAVILKRIYDR